MIAGCVGSGQKQREQARGIGWLGTEWNPSHHKSNRARGLENMRQERGPTGGRWAAFPNSRAASSGASLLRGAVLSP